jgi:2-aminoadipate transaminase
VTAARAEGRRVKFVYLVPNFQNPTGLLISQEKRRRLLDLADTLDLLIVEDDPYGALYFADTTRAEDTRPLKADDRHNRVVYLSSFSKTLSPAFRVAWMNAPADLISRFETAKQCLDLCTSDFNQHLVLEAVTRGVLDRQVPRLRSYYQASRTTMESALRQRLGGQARWVTPRGGFFLWVSLPERVDTTRLLPRAMGRGVIYVAGAAFFVDGTGAHTLRLAFSLAPGARIVDGISRLADAVAEELTEVSPVAH